MLSFYDAHSTTVKYYDEHVVINSLLVPVLCSWSIHDLAEARKHLLHLGEAALLDAFKARVPAPVKCTKQLLSNVHGLVELSIFLVGAREVNQGNHDMLAHGVVRRRNLRPRTFDTLMAEHLGERE